MCSGVEIALLAATAVSTVGTLKAGEKQQEAYNYNAQVAEETAVQEQKKSAYDEQMHRAEVRRILSTQRALYGKSGVTIEGSPLLVMEDTAKQGELDALAIRYGGDVAAARARSEASLLRMQGENVREASYYQAGSTLLGGGTSLFLNRRKLSRGYYDTIVKG